MLPGTTALPEVLRQRLTGSRVGRGVTGPLEQGCMGIRFLSRSPLVIRQIDVELVDGGRIRKGEFEWLFVL